MWVGLEQPAKGLLGTKSLPKPPRGKSHDHNLGILPELPASCSKELKLKTAISVLTWVISLPSSPVGFTLVPEPQFYDPIS